MTGASSIKKNILSNVVWTLAACLVVSVGVRLHDGTVDWKFVLEFGIGSALATMSYQLLARRRIQHRELGPGDGVSLGQERK